MSNTQNEHNNFFNKDFLYLLGCNFICFFLIHSTRIFSFASNHDGLGDYPTDICPQCAYNWWIMIGRFLQPVWAFFRGTFDSMIVVGAWSVVFFTIATVALAKIFNVKGLGAKLLISLILITSTTTVAWFATYKHLDFAIIAHTMAILAVYMVTTKEYSCKKQLLINLACAIAFLIISFGFYQSEIQSFLIVSSSVLFFKYLETNDLKVVMFIAFKLLIVCAIATILYFVIFMIIMKYKELTLPNFYNSPKNLLSLTFPKIWEMICRSYSVYWYCYLNFIRYANDYTKFILLASLALSLFIPFWIIIRVKEKVLTKLFKFIAFGVTVSLIPILSLVAMILSMGHNSDLQIYAICLVVLFPLLVLNKCQVSIKYLHRIVYTMLIIIAYFNAIYANGLYNKLYLVYQATMIDYARIVSDIEQTDHYEIGKTRVVFLGDLNKDPNISCKFYSYNYNYHITGADYLCRSTTYEGTLIKMIDLLGHKINIVLSNEIYKMNAQEDAKAMPSFPEKGYIKRIGNTVVVKLSPINLD